MKEYTISELQGLMSSGCLTAREVVHIYLERIELVDRSGPKINSIIETNPEAPDIAAGLDRERAEGKLRGPLHGIPILIKDNINTSGCMMTTAGSLALEGNSPIQDAFLVEKLRSAGAIILGKTNLSEWANFRSTQSVSGWSSRGGQTLNPYALDRDPCGSSSGSGAAASANLCAGAVGTETDGSIICPSQTNGIVGIKPTLGLISRSGIIPIARSQDSAGPMTRTVADAAALLSVMAGIDPLDPVTTESTGKSRIDYTQFLTRDGLKGARIGVMRTFFGFHHEVDRIMEDCLQVMKSFGAELVDGIEMKTSEEVGPTELEVLYYEFKDGLNAYLSGLSPDVQVHSIEDVIAFNEHHREKVMPFFAQEHFYAAQRKGNLDDEVYKKALNTNHRLSRNDGIDLPIQKHHLDALVAPSGGPAILMDYIARSHSPGGEVGTLPAVAGYPHITVPAGYVYGLPVGLSFIGPAYSEPVLIRLAYAFEQATQVRKEPLFNPSIHL